MDVAFFAAAPLRQSLLRVVRHRRGIGRNAIAMKSRLRQPPLPQPEIAFRRQQPFAEQIFVRLKDAALVIQPSFVHQHVLDQVGMIDEKRAEISNAHPPDVSILARQVGEIPQWILLQCAKQHGEQSVRRPRRKLRLPPPRARSEAGTAHAEMLENTRAMVNAIPNGLRSRRLSEAGLAEGYASRARNAHTRNADRSISTAMREKPAAVRRPNAEAGATGTNVLLKCPTRCSQPSRISNAKNIPPGRSTR